MSEPSKRFRNRAKYLLSISVRSAAIAITLGLGIYTLETVSTVLHGPAVTPGGEPDRGPAAVEAIFDEAIPEGGWALDSQPFRIAASECAADELAARMDRPPPAEAPTGTLNTAVLRNFRDAARQPCETGWRYRIVKKDWRAVAFTRVVRGEERWTLGRVAYPVEGQTGRWALLEILPVAGTRPAGASDLLPLPEGSLVLANRAGADGVRWAELVKVAGSQAALREYWQAHGWTWSARDAASGRIEGACRKGTDVVHVWSPGAEVEYLFLIRGKP